ncbi:sensor histidine kinase [Streptomyces sp. NPDC020096]
MSDDQAPRRGGAHEWEGGPPWGGPPWLRQRGDSAVRWPVRSSLVVAFIQVMASTFASRHAVDRVHLDAFAYALLLAGPALLVLRLRLPRVAVYGTMTVTLGYLAGGYAWGPFFLSFLVAFCSAVVRGHRRDAWAAAAGIYVGHLLVGHWLYRWLPPAGQPAEGWGQEFGIAAWLLALGAAAELIRVRREQLVRARRERAEAERHRADEERLRIARELHDVIAHSLSVINVQAGVGLALIDERPEQARIALTTIKAASKEALGEVRQVLGTLRSPGSAPRTPAPGLDRIPELAGQAAAAGLQVTVDIDGTARPLPPGAELAAFRIVQEALTNIVRHSGARTARVRIGYQPQVLELRIDDDGPATAGGDSGGGNGLIGMRERAAALGGTVEAGPRGDGGFRVVATLPVTGPDSVGPATEEEGR